MNAPSTRRYRLATYRVEIDSADCFSDIMTGNPRHPKIRSVDESTSTNTGQHTLYEFFTPVPKPRSEYEYTATTKEDAQTDRNKGMQDRTLDTNSVLKHERSSSTATAKEDAQIN